MGCDRNHDDGDDTAIAAYLDENDALAMCAALNDLRVWKPKVLRRVDGNPVYENGYRVRDLPEYSHAEPAVRENILFKALQAVNPELMGDHPGAQFVLAQLKFHIERVPIR